MQVSNIIWSKKSYEVPMIDRGQSYVVMQHIIKKFKMMYQEQLNFGFFYRISISFGWWGNQNMNDLQRLYFGESLTCCMQRDQKCTSHQWLRQPSTKLSKLCKYVQSMKNSVYENVTELTQSMACNASKSSGLETL